MFNNWYSFGSNVNFYGQLGIGHNDSINKPVKIEFLEDVYFVECGGNHIVCKTLNNNIFVWGYNYYGQLGIGDTKNQNKPLLCLNWLDNIVDVKCGTNHTMVLTSNQEVFSCGNNEQGQLGRFINEDDDEDEKR